MISNAPFLCIYFLLNEIYSVLLLNLLENKFLSFSISDDTLIHEQLFIENAFVNHQIFSLVVGQYRLQTSWLERMQSEAFILNQFLIITQRPSLRPPSRARKPLAWRTDISVFTVLSLTLSFRAISGIVTVALKRKRSRIID